MANEYLPANFETFMQAVATDATEGLGSTLSVSVTYTRQDSRTFAASAGTESETTTTGAVTAHRIGLDSQQGESGEEQGDVAFLITRSALEGTSLGSSFVPKESDRITYESEQYEILRWALDAAELRYSFVCKRVST